MLPAARARALSMLQNEHVYLSDLAEVIAADPGLTMVLLRAANSAQSASRRRIDSARDALIRLGLTAAKRMVAAAIVGTRSSTSTSAGSTSTPSARTPLRSPWPRRRA
ncbi:MAG: HDOD domain-containing protein [Dehalococcoidia bacterium]|nr:HDOD domain-containing protein [Dehalococcoidia bacterium]